MNTHTRFARMLFTVFLALAWCGVLSAQDVPEAAKPPVEKKFESPPVEQLPAIVTEKPVEKAPELTEKKAEAVKKPAVKKPAEKAAPAAVKKAPVVKGADKKPLVRKAPPKKAPAKDPLAPEKKPEDKKPAPKAPLEKKRTEKKGAAAKPVKKAPARDKDAMSIRKDMAVKDTFPAIEPEPPKPFYRIMRADVDDAVFADWSALRNDVELRNWAKSQGLVLANDAPPLAGGKARFVRQYGSTLRLDGLDRNSKYRLYLDFVTFDDPSRLNIPAALEIYVDGLLGMRLSFGEMSPGRNPVVVEIPYQLAMDGKVEVLFRDHSRTGGFFGVWDAVLTDQYALPASFDEPKRERAVPKSMQVKDAPLEARPVVKKRPAKIERGPKKEAPAKEKPAGKKGAAETPADKPADKNTGETVPPPDVKKPDEEIRKPPVAPELGETPTVKDPSAPSGPIAPLQPK
ncbi:MAG: hypothetical protein EHM32_08735 [Spirochaetales bacterium]|nr:MAG: hypothetical protein EHM32_08735 [Spirochaetales bacterium]